MGGAKTLYMRTLVKSVRLPIRSPLYWVWCTHQPHGPYIKVPGLEKDASYAVEGTVEEDKVPYM